MRRRFASSSGWPCAVAIASALVPLAPAAAQNAYARRAYMTQRTAEAPRIDGRIDDACWNTVEWATDFVQWEPAEGKPPTHQTSFKILYDERNLYLAYRAYDSEPDKIVRQLARRDNFPGDWVEVNIDSYHDNRTAYSFTSSVSGVRGDEFISKDGDSWDGNWDPIWELQTQVDAEGWTAEVRIPLSQLRFSENDEQVWGIQVQRRLFRKEERSLWQPKSKDESGWVSRFGELRGIQGLHSQRQVELLPYTLGKGERFEESPGVAGSKSDIQFGLDGKIGVLSNLITDFTINPDFGQVEADPSEVNLTAFETRFSEKRPFFIEGNSIIDFQLSPAITGGSFTDDNLFYSRRIGTLRNAPFLTQGYIGELANYLENAPSGASIIGAAKLTGRSEHGLSVGVLESVTAEEQADLRGFGVPRDVAIEPLTNFLVGRMQQDFDDGNTRVGGMVTATNRRINASELRFLHTAAYTGGLDFQHQWQNKTWYVAGNGSLSRVQGSTDALLATQTTSAHYFQRPDNDYESVDTTRTHLDGYASSVRFGRSGGGAWRFETGGAMRSPGFEINDVGFMRRADEINQFTWVGWSRRNPFSIFRRMGINGNQWNNWDFGGQLLVTQFNTNANANFKNNWATGAGVTRALEHVSNSDLRGGPSSLWPGQTDSNFWVDTDYRRRVAASFGGSWSEADDDEHRVLNAWVDLTYRPSNALRFVLSPSYTTNEDELQFVTTRSFASGGRYLFGSLSQETGAITLRVDYTIRPNLTLQFYGAPFVSAGAYREFKNFTSPRAAEYRDRFHTFTSSEITYDPATSRYSVDENSDGTIDYSFGNPDFNVRDFNSNLVARWEFQPGSVAYLVWSQSRSDFAPIGDFDFNDDMQNLFDVHPHNIFLIKVSKWFSL